MIANAANGAQRAAMLTQRLLAFARRQPLDPKLTNVDQLIAGMSDFFGRTLGEKIELEVVGRRRSVAGRGGPGPDGGGDSQSRRERQGRHERQNSGATANSGKLTIETSNVSVDEGYRQQNAGMPAGQYVLIAVSDTGSGMSREVQEKAFDPFFTTKQPGQGTGLGFSQVYGFVRQSGGHIKIYSEVGEGTTIKIYLPRAAAAPEIADRARRRWSAVREVRPSWWSRTKTM